MQIKEFYRTLEAIKRLPLFNKFFIYLHGGILDHPKTTLDIDIKVVPRGSVSLREVEHFMESLSLIPRVEAVFMKEINNYAPKYKPSMEEIDEHDPPILQALYNSDALELEELTKSINCTFIYQGRKKLESLVGEKVKLLDHRYNSAKKVEWNPVTSSWMGRAFWLVEFKEGSDWVKDSQLKYTPNLTHGDNRHLEIGDTLEYIENPKLIRYRQIGKMTYYVSGEWAIKGHKIHVDHSRVINCGNLEIREADQVAGWKEF
jgi:hypothetical protein